MTTTTPLPIAAPGAGYPYRAHASDGRIVAARNERDAAQYAEEFARMTADAVAVERFDVDRGEWVLVDVIGARS